MSATESTTAPGPPRDVEITVPPGWWPLDLDPGRTARSVQAILDRQFRGRDDLPHVKADLARSLLEQAEGARDNGGVQLWLCLELAGPLPLPASLLVTVVGAPGGVDAPGPDEDTLDAVLDALYALRLRRGDEVEFRTLTLGRALRTRRTAPVALPPPGPPGPPGGPPPDDAADAPTATMLDFHVRIPATDRLLLLTFSTPIPLPELVEAFLDLFDAIAEGVRWIR